MQASSYHPDFGPLQRDAERLISRASGFVQRNQSLDILHILFAALTPSESQFSNLLAERLTLIEQAEMIGGVRVEMRVMNQPSADGKITDRLRACAAVWRDNAAKNHLHINEALILWTIITRDDTLQRALVDIIREASDARDAQATFTEITQKLNNLFLYDDGQLPPPPNFLEQYLRAVQVGGDLDYWKHHRVLVANVLDVLASSVDENNSLVTHIPIIAGANGTPLDKLPQIIAERFADNEQLTMTRTVLERFRKQVYMLDIYAVSSIEHDVGKPHPAEVLSAAMQQVANEGALLLLDHFEVLQKPAVAAQYRASLANPGHALILGIYHLDEEEGRAKGLNLAQKLDIRNLRQIFVPPYSVEMTQNLLQSYYLPRWERQYKCIFTPDAFDLVLELEPGCWIEEQRKMLPYLIVDLARSTMANASDVEELRATLDCAITWLNHLQHTESTTAKKLDLDKFMPVLERAGADFQMLKADPLPKKNDGKYILTRGHVTANLICHNQSEFHFPGIKPSIQS